MTCFLSKTTTKVRQDVGFFLLIFLVWNDNLPNFKFVCSTVFSLPSFFPPYMFGLEWQLTWFELVCSTMFSIILASLSIKSQCYSISQIQLALILLLNTGGPQLTENHIRHEQFDSCRQSVPIKTQNSVKRSALILCKLSKEKPASQFPSLVQLPMKYDWQDFPC